MALLRCDVDYAVHEVRYWEGFYIGNDLPVATEHAWLTINGKVVDLTQPRDEFDYFGVEIPWELVRQYMLETETHGPLLVDWDLGWKYTAEMLDPDGSARLAFRMPPRIRSSRH